MRLSDNFKLSYGVRVDVPVWEDGLANADFNNRTIPLLQAAENLQGATVGCYKNYSSFCTTYRF
jgi:hypothetical protein